MREKVFLTKDARKKYFLPDIQYTVKNILSECVCNPIMICAEELGHEWVFFVKENEIVFEKESSLEEDAQLFLENYLQKKVVMDGKLEKNEIIEVMVEFFMEKTKRY